MKKLIAMGVVVLAIVAVRYSGVSWVGAETGSLQTVEDYESRAGDEVKRIKKALEDGTMDGAEYAAREDEIKQMMAFKELVDSKTISPENYQFRAGQEMERIKKALKDGAMDKAEYKIRKDQIERLTE